MGQWVNGSHWFLSNGFTKTVYVLQSALAFKEAFDQPPDLSGGDGKTFPSGLKIGFYGFTILRHWLKPKAAQRVRAFQKHGTKRIMPSPGHRIYPVVFIRGVTQGGIYPVVFIISTIV